MEEATHNFTSVTKPANFREESRKKKDFFDEEQTEAAEAALRKNIPVPWKPECDIFSLGATLSFLLVQECLSVRVARLSERIRILNDQFTRAGRLVSAVLVKLICECLDPNASKRPSALEVLSVALNAQRLCKQRFLTQKLACLCHSSLYTKSSQFSCHHRVWQVVLETANRNRIFFMLQRLAPLVR